MKTDITQASLKHLDNNIWELRPLKDRILFVGWLNGIYVLLYQFVKNIKTPAREIEKAKKELTELVKRGEK